MVLDSFVEDSMTNEDIHTCFECGTPVPEHLVACWNCGQVLDPDIRKLGKTK